MRRIAIPSWPQFYQVSRCFIETLVKIENDKKVYYIVCYQNIDIIRYSSSKPIRDCIDALHSINCISLINKPTGIMKHSATCLDHIYCNGYVNLLTPLILVDDISDHFPTCIKISNFNNKSEKTKLTIRDLKGFSDQDFIADVKAASEFLTTVAEHHGANELFNLFHFTMSTAVNHHAPIRNMTRKEINFRSKPWITNGIKKSIDMKSKLLNQVVKYNRKELYDKYKIYRNKINHLIDASRKSY